MSFFDKKAEILLFFKDYRIYVILFIFAIMLLPLFNYVINNFVSLEKSDNRSLSNTAIELSKDTVVTQKLNFDAVIKGITLSLDEKSENTSGTFEVSLTQGNNTCKKIFSYDYTTNKLVRDFVLPDDIFNNLEYGEVLLTLRGISEDAPFAHIALSSNLMFGRLAVNGQSEQNQNLSLLVNTASIPPLSLARLILLILVFVVFIFMAKILLMPEENDILYWLATIAIILVFCFRMPYWSIMAEPISEWGMNFVDSPSQKGGWGAFFTKDYNYWPLFPVRIISLVAYYSLRTFNLMQFLPLLMAFMGVIVVALVFALICLKQYEPYAPKAIRLLFCLLLAFTVPYNANLMIFYNVGYFGFIAIILVLLLDFSKISTRQYALILLTSLFCISKIFYIILVPVFIVSIVFCIVKKVNKKLTGFFATLALTSTIQLIYCLRVEGSALTKEHTLIWFWQLFKASFYYFSLSTYSFFIPSNIKAMALLTHLISVSIIITIVGFLLYAFHKGEKTLSALSFSLLIFAYLNQIILFFGNQGLNLDINFLSIINYNTQHRQNFPINASFYFSVVFCIFIIIKQFSKKIALTVIAFFVFIQIPHWATPTFQIVDNYSQNWKYIYQNIHKASYMISSYETPNTVFGYATPEGFAWLFGKNTGVVRITSRDNNSSMSFRYNNRKIMKVMDNRPAHYINITKDVGEQILPITVLYATKQRVDLANNGITARFLNKNGGIIAEIQSQSDKHSTYLVFDCGDGLKDVDKLVFIDKDGAYVDLNPDFYFGCSTL